MKRATRCIALAALVAAFAHAAPAPPSAGVWNIATSGKAASSGDLAFRVTATDGSDPVDITVPVISGASEDSVARSIRRVLSSQLPRDRYSVQLGEGANVLVSDPRGRPNFTLELVDSDIENVRVAVQSVTPAAGPTVPPQSVPAEAPPVNPPANTVPGNAAPPASAEPPIISAPPSDAVPPAIAIPSPSPSAPPPASAAPAPGGVPAPSPTVPGPRPTVPGPSPTVPSPSPSAPESPPNAPGGAGAPASAPPPRS
jgi:hypothetical protein